MSEYLLNKAIIRKSTLTEMRDILNDKTKNDELISPEDYGDIISSLKIDNREKRIQFIERTVTALSEGDLKGITKVKTGAFLGCKDLITVELPKTVKEIGKEAFKDCQSLETVIFKGDDWEFGNLGLLATGAFQNSGLKYITLPANMSSIPMYTFADCKSLHSVTFNLALECIVSGAFSNCVSLTSIDLSNTVITELSGFYGCTGLTSVVFPSTLTEIDSMAFSRCAISELNLPEGLTFIGRYAFRGNNFSNLTIPASVTRIDGWAFEDCINLTEVTFLSDTPPIFENNYLFYGCSNLKKITVPQGASTAYKSAIGMENYAHLIVEPESELDDGRIYFFENKLILGDTSSYLGDPPIDGVLYFAKVDGIYIGSGRCYNDGGGNVLRVIQYINDDYICLVYDYADGWMSGDLGEEHYVDLYYYENRRYALEPIKANGGDDNAGFGYELSEAPIIGETYHLVVEGELIESVECTDAEYICGYHIDTTNGEYEYGCIHLVDIGDTDVLKEVLIYRSVDKLNLIFPTDSYIDTSGSYVEGEVLCGNNAVARVELADSVKIDGEDEWSLANVEYDEVYLSDEYLHCSDPCIAKSDTESIGFDISSPLDLSTLNTGKTYEIWSYMEYKIADLVFGRSMSLELHRGLQLIGEIRVACKTGGSTICNFEGFNGEMIYASGHYYHVVASASINGEQIVKESDSVLYP